MSFPEVLLSQGTVERLGWMLVHFLWQGAVVAVLLAAVLRLLPRAGANLRYLIACSALVMMVMLPIVTIQFIEVAGPAAEAGPSPLAASPDVAPLVPSTVQVVDEMPALPDAIVPLETADLTTPVPLQERIASALEPALPWLVAGWLVGVLGLSTWHVGGWAQLQRLKRRMVRRVGANLQQQATTLGARLGVRRAVTLLESALVEVPTVVGWLRPAILLPASALTGLSPEQLEAILAHELAHIRRYDYLVNMLQTVVEILGFYHPAVWWVSHRIRIERENCCDDLAVRLCGDSVRYARALTCLEEIRHSQAELAVAATGGSLIERIARLLGRPATDDRRLAWLPGLIALLLIAGVVIPVAFALAGPEARLSKPPDDAAVLPDEAQVRTEPNEPDRARIRISYTLVEVFADRTLDPQAAAEARELLVRRPPGNVHRVVGPVPPPSIEELQRPLRDVLAGSMPARNKDKKLVDFLISRGYVRVLSNPELELFAGEPGSIVMGDAQDVNAPARREVSKEDGPAYMRLEATPHVPQDSNTVLVDTTLVLTYRADRPGDPNGQRTTTEVKTTSAIPDGQYSAVFVGNTPGQTQENTNTRLHILLVGPRIVRPGTAPVENTDELSVSEPNDAVADEAQVLVKARIIEAVDSRQLDRETVLQIEKILGKSVQPQGRTGKSSRSRPTVGDFLRAHVVQQPLPNETVQALIDLLASKGYVNVLAQPQVIAQDGQQSQIKAGSNEYFWMGSSADGSRRSTELQKVEVGTILNVTPHVQDNDNIVLDIKVELSNAVPGPKKTVPPVISTRSVTATVTTRSGQYVTLAGMWDANTRNRAKETKSVYIIAMPTLLTPPSSAQVYVQSGSNPNEPRAGEDRQFDIGFKIATVADRQHLDLDTAIQIEQILGRRVRPQGQDGQPEQALDLTLGEVFQNHIAGQILTEETVQSLTALLSSRGHILKMLATPRVLTRDGVEARIFIGGEIAVPGKDPGTFDYVDIGTKINVTPRIEDANTVTLETAVELSELVSGSENKEDTPIVRRRVNKTEVTTLSDRYFVYPMGQKQDSEEGSQYIMVKPTIVESPDPGQSEAQVGVPSTGGPESRVTATFHNTDLRQALAEISRRGGVNIAADETVKPQTVTAQLVDASVADALRQILKGTPYTFKKIGETANAPRERAGVSMVFQGDDLHQVLQDLSVTAGVPILADETVAGQVYADIKDVPLERALEMVLAGKPYAIRKTPDYYFVADMRLPGSKDRRILDERRNVSPWPQGAYLVYRPISQVFVGDDRRQALMDLAAVAEISIAVDENLTGKLYADLNKVPLETAFRIILTGTPYIAVKKAGHYEVVVGAVPPGSKVGDDKEGLMTPMDRSDSRAWTILRQWNCPPLLLGLTQQFAKVLQSSRQSDPVWQPVSDGGTLRLRLDVEGGLPGEVIVGLFKDARWLDEPVAVRRLSGAGTHMLTGLPPGRYEIGAMIGDVPLPLALGVHRTWPEPVEIRPGQTVTADVLVSEAFQKHATGAFNDEVAKDYLGQWGDLNEANLLQGQLTGPDGKPIRFGYIQIREHNPGARGIAAPDQGADEQGIYKFDEVAWAYRVNAAWRETIPSAFGYRSQWIFLGRVLEGPQRLDLRFKPFPEGTAKVAGRVIDQNGQPVKVFFLRVLTPPFSDIDLSSVTGEDKTQVTYDMPFISDDGRFEVGGLPAGRATVDPIPFETQRYQHEWGKEIVLEAGNTASVDFELIGKSVFYGRVLFEDGSPAVITPAPWRDAATRILMPSGGRARGLADVDADGYFTLYLDNSETEALALDNSRLQISVPADQEHHANNAGDFPYEKLSQDKSRAGVVTVKRPLPTPTLPLALRQGRPLPQGWSLEYQERSGPGERRMTQVSVSVKSAAPDSQVSHTPVDEQFELYGPDGKRVQEFRVRSAFILDKAQQYVLIGRSAGARASGGWRITHGPFTLDLSRPGQYTLTVDPATHSEPGSEGEQDAASISDSTGAVPASQPADGSFSARLERLLILSQAAQTTDIAKLPDVFEEQPPGSKSYEVRAGIIVGRHPTEFLTGDFYYLPDRDIFYVQHSLIGSSTLAYYGPIKGKPWQVLNAPEMQMWRIEPWSEAVEGVQIRLRATRKNWRADKIPALHWDVRNAGARQYLETLANRSGVQLEVDGAWYVWPVFLWGGRVATLGVGRSLDDQLVALSPMWSKAKPEDLQPRVDWGGPVDTTQTQSSLQLTPGKHTIRVAVIVLPSRVMTGEPFRVVSLPLEITIAPRWAGKTLFWPPGPELAEAVKETLYSTTLALQWRVPPKQPQTAESTPAAQIEAATERKGALAQSMTSAQNAVRAAERAAALARNTPLEPSLRQLADALAALQKFVNNNPANTRDQLTAAGKAYSHLIDVFSGESPPTAQPPGAARRDDSATPVTSAPRDPGSSQAWTIMRQINCPPLLLGLTQQLLKTLQPARQNDAMWREALGGGSLKLDVKVGQEDASREIVVGLFKDAKWQEEPVAVRLLPGAGTHTLAGLPPGRYQIGAMIGRAPSAAALGVQRTWPQVIEIESGRTATAELLVSRDFAFNASGWYNQEVSRDYIGDWSLLDKDRLLQGRLTGPDGEPIRFAQVQVREYQAVRTGSIAAPELGTNEDGVYKFDGMKWPYCLGAIWTDPLPSVLGCRYQFKYLNRVFEGPQQVDFRFDRFPQGTAKVSGRVVDQDGNPLKGFVVRINTSEFATASREGKQSTPDGRTYTEYGYTVPFISEDGRFELTGLPPGPMLAHAIPFDTEKYEFNSHQEILLEAGQTTSVELTLTAKDASQSREKPAETSQHTEDGQAIEIGVECRFVLVDDEWLNAFTHGLPLGGVTSPEDVNALHEIGAGVSAGAPSVLNPAQADLLLTAVRGHGGNSMLAAPRVTVLDGEPATFSLSDRLKYISGYTEPNEPSREPVPEHGSETVGVTCNITPTFDEEHDSVHIEMTTDIRSLLEIRKVVYRDSYEYEVPVGEDAHVSLEAALPNGWTALTCGDKVAAFTGTQPAGDAPRRQLLILLKATRADAAPPTPAISPLPGGPGMGGLRPQ